MNNYMKLTIPSKTSNEAFARAAVGAFAAQTDITVEDLSDIKTAVSEAVTNSIIHGYSDSGGVILIFCRVFLSGGTYTIEITVEDKGKGIENIERAMQPLYTTSENGERSGMGFTVMQSFMDELEVKSEPGCGTLVKMVKRVGAAEIYE
ncbi:MAG TPA: anti-sigma F factor [Candidatus Monoglobus merdigallinarum]|uniref:Anti-sigma F factor n=1 Tax=Candidatus Monoglobus merdigallinarum TaxID=2838698 RepID=A0A9D1TLF1_9FIRM|nr:anti-sigma F factor [Candidatus Monoglobus merdigallinarum]